MSEELTEKTLLDALLGIRGSVSRPKMMIVSERNKIAFELVSEAMECLWDRRRLKRELRRIGRQSSRKPYHKPFKRPMGEDELTGAYASLARSQVPRDPEMDKAVFDNVTELYEE